MRCATPLAHLVPRGACGLIAALTLAGCSAHPSCWSEHFELGFLGESRADCDPTLTRFEAHRQVFFDATGLTPSLPDRVGYWLTDDVNTECGEKAYACNLSRWVYAPVPFEQHELVHAYLYLAAGAIPVGLLNEGTAVALSCAEDDPLGDLDDADITQAQSSTVDQLIGAPMARYIYEGGALLIGDLVARFGLRATSSFVTRTMESSDERTTTRAVFQSSFGEALDDAYRRAVARPPDKHMPCMPLYQCGLAAPAPFGEPITLPSGTDDPAGARRFTLMAPTTVELAVPLNNQVEVLSCSTPAVPRVMSPRSAATRLVLDAGEYLVRNSGIDPIELSIATVPTLLSSSCADATSRPFVPDTRSVAFRIEADATETKYLAVDAPFTQVVVRAGPVSICASCDTALPDCQRLEPGDIVSRRDPYVLVLPPRADRASWTTVSLDP